MVDEEAFRNVAARCTAQGFIVELLLVQYLKQFPAGEIRDGVVSALRATSKRTEQYANRAVGDDHLAELLADIAVRSQGFLDEYFDRALERLKPPDADATF